MYGSSTFNAKGNVSQPMENEPFLPDNGIDPEIAVMENEDIKKEKHSPVGVFAVGRVTSGRSSLINILSDKQRQQNIQ